MGIALGVFLFGAFVSFSPLFAHAQTTPQFMVSWSADSYVPHWYQGKVLPGNSSPVDVRFSLIDRGVSADLSRYKIRWYVNDELVANETQGLGIRSRVVMTPRYGRQDVAVRIVVLDYRGVRELATTVSIPLASPEAVIDGAYANQARGVSTKSFTGYPFFFAAEQADPLLFSWKVFHRNVDVADSPSRLRLTIDSKTPLGAEIPVSVFIKNAVRDIEFANKDIVFRVE